MSVNTSTNANVIAAAVSTEGTTYGLAAPVATAGFSAGDTYYVTPSGTSATAASASAAYRFDGTRWVQQPGKGAVSLTPELVPVKDFQTQAELDALAAATPKPNDQTSYIVTDGANKGKIATWDAASLTWLYYTPSEGEITTMTNPADEANQGKWKYDAVSATWVQTEIGLILPDPVVRPVGGMNIAFPSTHHPYKINSTVGLDSVIQNDGILAWGTNVNRNGGDGANNSGFPKKLPFSWWNLNANNSYVPVANYKPTFTDLDDSALSLIAVDSIGKVWIQASAILHSGHTTTPTSDVAVASIPSRALYPVQFFQGRSDIIASRVYTRSLDYAGATPVHAVLDTLGRLWVTGINTNGELGQGNTTNLVGWRQWGTIEGIVEVKISSNGIFARTSTGDLYFAGLDSTGRWLGGAANTKYQVPTLVTSNVLSFDFGSTINNYLCVVKNDNTLWAGGINTAGQLGFGDVVSPKIGLTQVTGITNAKKVICDKMPLGLSSCIIRTDGTISFTGNNRAGIFGFQGSTAAATPLINTYVTPNGAMQGTVIDVVIMNTMAVAMTGSGTLWRTGSLNIGGLGASAGTSWVAQNSWKRLPLPEAVLGFRCQGDGRSPEEDSIQVLTAVRGLIGMGIWESFQTNAYYTAANASYREMGDLRTWDTGILTTAPLDQTF
jgi:alpha-tubulin suppressor-like RCC1 family protein